MGYYVNDQQQKKKRNEVSSLESEQFILHNLILHRYKHRPFFPETVAAWLSYKSAG